MFIFTFPFPLIGLFVPCSSLDCFPAEIKLQENLVLCVLFHPRYLRHTLCPLVIPSFPAGLMKTLKILDPVIDHLDLLLHHRHPSGKVVVLPDFPGKFLHFGLHNRLGFAVGDENTDQRDASGDHGCKNGLQHLTSSTAHQHGPTGHR